MSSDLEQFAMVPGDLIGAVSPAALECWAILALWFPHDGKTPFRPPIARMAGALDKSRRSIERAIMELEKSGRLQRASGARGGKANTYTLRFCKRAMLPQGATDSTQAGATDSTQGYDKNAAGYIDVVQTTLTDPLVVPQTRQKSNDSRPNNPTAAHTQFHEFWKAYPRRAAMPAARKAWAPIPAREYPAVIAAAQRMALIWRKCDDHQRRYFPTPAKWLELQSWNDDPEAVATAFGVPGLFKQAARGNSADRDPIAAAFRAPRNRKAEA